MRNSRRPFPIVLLSAVALSVPAAAYAQHVDPDTRAHAQDLTFAVHPDTTITTATIGEPGIRLRWFESVLICYSLCFLW